jgi:hypothetical protein
MPPPHTLRIHVIDADGIDAGRWENAFIDLGYEGGRRRSKVARIGDGKALFLSTCDFAAGAPPTSTVQVRLMLDSTTLGTKERSKTMIQLDDVIISGRKHNFRVVLDPIKETTVLLAVCFVGPDGVEPPMAVPAPVRVGGPFAITVGTQTTESRVHAADIPSATFSFTTVDKPWRPGHHAPDPPSPGSPATPRTSASRSRAAAGRPALDPGCGVAMDMELVKRLAAAWPTDQVEGLLVYCQHLKAQKEVAERELVREQLTRAKFAIARLQDPPSRVLAFDSPEFRQSANDSRFLPLPFPAPGHEDVERRLTKIAIMHGHPLSDEQKTHIAQHYDEL